MKIIGDYGAGDLAGYAASGATMRATLESLRGPVLVAHHGDGDGIVGGGLLGCFFAKRGIEVAYASAPEFRLKDLPYFEREVAEKEIGIFIEAQGMPPEYARLDPLFMNIDHHPHPEETPIRRMHNPRRHGIEPNPAIGFVMYELLEDALPPQAAWLAALASIVDYCPDPARAMIERESASLARLDDLRDTFLASQYVLPHTTGLAALAAELPTPDALLDAEPYTTRRHRYQNLLRAGIASAEERPAMVLAATEAGEYRIASPLANRLQDLHPHKTVVVIERSGDTRRLSVRSRRSGLHLGALLGRLATAIGEGDGTGHESAGSARIPAPREAEFLRLLEDELG